MRRRAILLLLLVLLPPVERKWNIIAITLGATTTTGDPRVPLDVSLLFLLLLLLPWAKVP